MQSILNKWQQTEQGKISRRVIEIKNFQIPEYY